MCLLFKGQYRSALKMQILTWMKWTFLVIEVELGIWRKFREDH